MSEDTEMKFDLIGQIIPVTLHKDGKDIKYTLREMSAADRDSFLNNFNKRFELDEKGKPKRIKDYENMQSDLVWRSMFDEAGKKLNNSTVQSWPGRVVHALYMACSKLNNLDAVKEIAAEGEEGEKAPTEAEEAKKE